MPTPATPSSNSSPAQCVHTLHGSSGCGMCVLCQDGLAGRRLDDLLDPEGLRWVWQVPGQVLLASRQAVLAIPPKSSSRATSGGPAVTHTHNTSYDSTLSLHFIYHLFFNLEPSLLL